MPSKQSAGLLMFRRRNGYLEVLLGHPGGPYWQGKRGGAWTIHKGGIEPDETLLDAAIREFREETGVDATGPYVPLGQITQRSGKIVYAWAFEGDCDPASLISVDCDMEWPPKSGKVIVFPEIERSEFFTLNEARSLINPAQVTLLSRLEDAVGGAGG